MPDAPSHPPFAVRLGVEPLPAHDPLELYTRLSERLGAEQVYLLESLTESGRQGGPAVVGCGPLAEIRLYGSYLEIDGSAEIAAALRATAEAAGLSPAADAPGRLEAPGSAGIWEFLRRAQGLFGLEPGLPGDRFHFGFLARFGYDAAWHMEDLPARALPPARPDAVLTLFRDSVHYDTAGTPVLRTADSPAFGEAGRHDVAGAAREAAGQAPQAACPPAGRPQSVHDSVDRDTFHGWVRRCLEHIGVGDIYQIQVGHRIDVRTALTPVEVYRRLRSRNPSPHMYLLPNGDGSLIGASPELLFRIEDGRIVMRPIAGTTRRDHDEEENERRIKALLASTKEQAEHVMLVDLSRNDISRVCRPHTLTEDELMVVETFSHVFHLVSTVSAELEEDADVWRSLCATFPAGTMTGAPKLRAMEIIHEIEREPRGAYAGAVGLIDVGGWSELALCIRTIAHDGAVYSVQSSAGIVADSTPEGEWNETLAKLGAAYWALTGEELTA
ncbi:anthranilate synthase component 1 [Kitasatospora sp. MAA19]|uniref:anthranilate synthase component I family protein n=1 Tax=Kitasatospora sp. MAA19 TaxID=3035090 RepID=UPI002473E4B0|nr:anthranilate synthase component I family protein [Kitasatospora sp. MAA19]MDH6709583.1 anthranilate synthase component 1 [Kitasatospora sp. MAA19]